MKFYDLFAGIGGFRLGLEANGHECVGSCEIDKHARAIYQKHFGDVPDLDATKLDARAMPDFDILAAGFPCQAFSLAGKRLGFEDTRGTLFFEIARIARQKRPGILFLENVEGLLFHDEQRTIWTILATLDELGYIPEWQVIDGSDWLPQARKRLFIIGHLGGEPFKQVFPLREGEGETSQRISTHCIDANYWKGIDNHAQRSVIAMSAGFFGRNGRLAKEANEPAFTLTARPQDSIIHDGLNLRMMTPLECERLQGFPDGWTSEINDTARYRLLGNAVMPPVIEYIGRHLA